MRDTPYNVLFISTGNAARSIIAEVVLNHVGDGRFRAFSAGSRPLGHVHPRTLEVLSSEGYDVAGVRSKSWSEFATDEAPQMDFIFTVCDKAAGEVCPVWPGQPITAHWSFPDPAAVEGDGDKLARAFTNAVAQIARRIRLFLSLPMETIERMSLQSMLREFGHE
ncbi:arsenate reductase ArsC [Aromatoleum aromaticum]|uniref:Phosphotyrosine protein phosphatase I domain-containing protein n=1 Tax=Aromatoleum aromaticum (strain DSM 19018 / LMG 30748 / EbN1) TaxID=76114 RepID=Q5P059_AROAE|nr:arsenate reductase ArsC [Aromatoleum aromaticum]NMG56246.1 arsenate reductase ArsC [Aromatoleum aromaticum]CAI09305.1 conserved hypothetical protein, similar to arsenate reductase subunit ArsC [Aromatoleum aromaticum EbN1]